MDIDACDVENELAVVEYVEDIYKFYKLAEVYIILFLLIFTIWCVIYIVECVKFQFHIHPIKS